MAFSYSEATGDGSTTVFPFSFSGGGLGYIRTTDIHVLVDGVEIVDFILSGTNQVQLAVAPAIPADGLPNIMIRRIVPKEVPYADFTRGNNFGQSQINNTALQQLYALHEFLDGFLPDGYFIKGDMDFKGARIFNLPDGVGLTEPATVRQMQEAKQINTEAVALLQAEVSSAVTEFISSSSSALVLEITTAGAEAHSSMLSAAASASSALAHMLGAESAEVHSLSYADAALNAANAALTNTIATTQLSAVYSISMDFGDIITTAVFSSENVPRDRINLAIEDSNYDLGAI